MGDLDALSLQRALQIGVRFAKAKTTKSGADLVRQVIPADVRDEYKRLYGKSWEERVRIKPGTPPEQRKHLHGEFIAEINRRVAAIRASQRGDGVDLTHKDAHALAGEWYNSFVAPREDNPGEPEDWDTGYWLLIDRMREYAEEAGKHPERFPQWGRDPEVRARMRPTVADFGQTAQFLASRGLALTNEARELFLDCVLDNLFAAFSTLERRAKGDYSTDPLPKQFPPFLRPAVHDGAKTQSPWKLFEEWRKAAKPADGTVERWRVVFKNLEAKFAGLDAQPLTDETAQAWAKELIIPGRSPSTVRTWVRAARRVYAWAKSERLIKHNPFKEVSVTVPKKTKHRETDAFTAEEAQTILRAASNIKHTHKAFAAGQRWVPWLCAYSGARVGEITQLRGADIEHRGEFHFMRLTPDAGPIKTRKPRTVPLHEHVIEQGFLEYVKMRGKGPLFYEQDRVTGAGTVNDPMKPKRLPSIRVRERLAEWVRKIGIDDPEVQPNHAWRDTFKQIAERSGISERVHDAITGHAPRTVGRSYGQATPEDMAEALKKFPRYKI